jgi:hypothetical protein
MFRQEEDFREKGKLGNDPDTGLRRNRTEKRK